MTRGEGYVDLIRVKLVTTHPEQGPTRYVGMPVLPRPGEIIRLTDLKTTAPEYDKWVVRENIHTTSGYVEVHL